VALVYINTEKGAPLEPGWTLRLCWINDGFVLRASSVPFCAVDDYRQEISESNGSRSFGGTQGRLALTLLLLPSAQLSTNVRFAEPFAKFLGRPLSTRRCFLTGA
jgi:hypothetical protein